MYRLIHFEDVHPETPAIGQKYSVLKHIKHADLVIQGPSAEKSTPSGHDQREITGKISLSKYGQFVAFPEGNNCNNHIVLMMIIAHDHA